MTSKEFTLWLKGFTEGVHEFNITPKQWDLLKEKLAEVEDKVLVLESPKFPFGTPNTTPMWQHPHYVDPHNPYKITCGSGSSGTITTTPGVGSITIGNPPFGFGSTSTAYGYPSGSAWSYTTYQPYTTQTDDDFEKKIINEIKNKGLYTEPTSKFKKRKAKSVKEWEDTHDLGGEE